MSLQLIKDVTKDEESAINFLQERDTLRKTAPRCAICQRSMSFIRQGANREKMWRCPTHKAQKLSLRHGSFWQRSHVPLRKAIELLYFWSLETPVTRVAAETGLSERTCIQWYAFFRDVCSNWLLRNQVQIGGPGVVVQIDESVIARRKYNRGHAVKERWVFDGVCPTSGRGFLELVPDRSAPTLLPLVEKVNI